MKYNQNKGITLVSLVITIVIMLILAGVAISFVIGQNGLFTKSKSSVELYKTSSLEEQLKTKIAEIQVDFIDENKDLSMGDLKLELEKDTDLINSVICIYEEGSEDDIKYLKVQFKEDSNKYAYVDTSFNIVKKFDDNETPRDDGVLRIYNNGVCGVPLSGDAVDTGHPITVAQIGSEKIRLETSSNGSDVAFVSTLNTVDWSKYNTLVVRAVPDSKFEYFRTIFTTLENTRIVNADIAYGGDKLPHTVINGKNYYVFDISSVNSDYCLALTSYQAQNNGYIYEIYATNEAYSDVVNNLNK